VVPCTTACAITSTIPLVMWSWAAGMGKSTAMDRAWRMVDRGGGKVVAVDTWAGYGGRRRALQVARGLRPRSALRGIPGQHGATRPPGHRRALAMEHHRSRGEMAAWPRIACSTSMPVTSTRDVRARFRAVVSAQSKPAASSCSTTVPTWKGPPSW
jgi:hypothetical protein